MKQHLPALDPRDSAWLADTFARNRARFAGWSMEADDDDKDDDGKKDADDDGKKDADDGKKDEHGFPADTPVAEMTLAQQVAYHQHQSRKHESRAKAYRQAAGGKDPDDLKTIVGEAEEARRGKLTVDEKALEDARKEGEAAILADLAPKAVESAFKLLLGDMPAKEIEAEIELLDLKKFLTEDNQVDTDKVKARVKKIRPDKGQQQQQQRDFGQGRRGSSAPTGGVAAVMAERAARRAEKNKQ